MEKNVKRLLSSLMLILVIGIVGVVSVKHIVQAEEETPIDDCTEAIVVPLPIDDYRKETTTVTEEKDGEEYTYTFYTKAPKLEEIEGYQDKTGYIFAGWYTTQDCENAEQANKTVSTSVTSDTYYAKFVPAEILTVKSQISDEATTVDNINYRALRVITTVDSLWYSNVGFELTVGSTTITQSSNGVYDELYAVGETEGETIEYTPQGNFCNMSKHFKTWTFMNIPESAWDSEIYVRPFWVTMDGTRVYGENGEPVFRSVDLGLSIRTDNPFEARLDNQFYETLNSAVTSTSKNDATSDDKITLLKDIELDSTIAINGTDTSGNITLTNREETEVTIYSETNNKFFTVAENTTLTIRGTQEDSKDSITICGPYNKDLDTQTAKRSANMLQSNGTLKIYNATLKNAYGTAGAAVRIDDDGKLTMDNCLMTGNQGNNFGAAIFLDGATATGTISGTTFSYNHTINDNVGGAAIGVRSASLTVTECTFDNNSATTNGGAIYTNPTATGLETTVSIDATFSNNTAISGGAIYVGANAGDVNLGGSTFSSNTATNGGAVYVAGGTASVTTGAEFSSNTATNGGAVYVTVGTAEITGATFTGNTSTKDDDDAYQGNGGAVFIDDNGTATITGGSFSDNEALNGGAVHVHTTTSTLEVSDAEFSSNEATAKGGAVHLTNGEADITGGEFSENTAVTGGGGVYLTGGKASIIAAKFDTNEAYNPNSTSSGAQGGAVYVGAGTVTITGGEFSGNTARNGGALNVNSTDAELTVKGDAQFSNNEASSKGGALHVQNGIVTLTGAAISKNQANLGGAVYLTGGEATLSGAKLSNNKATSSSAEHPGHDVYVSAGKTINILNSDFAGDYDTNDGEVVLQMTEKDSAYTVATANVSGKVTDVVFRYNGYGSESTSVVTNGVCVGETPITSASDITIVPYKADAGTPVVFGTSEHLSATPLASFDIVPDGESSTGIYGVNSAGQIVTDNVIVAKNITQNTEHTTLNEAIADANSGDTITLLKDIEMTAKATVSNAVIIQPSDRSVTIYRDNSNLKSTMFDLDSEVSFTGASTKRIRVDGRSAGTATQRGTTSSTGAQLIVSDAKLSMEYVTVQYANSTSAGGAMRANNTLNVTYCKFMENYVSNGNGGAAIFLGGSTATLTKTIDDTDFINNESSAVGGAVTILSGAKFDVNITRCSFENNQATTSGGAIDSRKAEDTCEVTVVASTFKNNGATHGGAVSVGYNNNNNAATFSFDAACIFDSNTATTSGNDIYVGSASTCKVTLLCANVDYTCESSDATIMK